MSEAKVAVVGSVVKDRFYRVEALPLPGESVVATQVHAAPGGKGANQAMAAARLGVETAFLGKVGDDEAGREAQEAFERSPVEARLLVEAGAGTGQAAVTVEDTGENMIVVDLDANLRLSPEDVLAHQEMLAGAQVYVAQLEVPDETVQALARLGHEQEATTLLNLAPIKEGAAALVRGFEIVVLNRGEAEILAGVGVATLEDAQAAVRAIHGLGVPTPIVTLGPAGAVYLFEGRVQHAASPPVEIEDSTGAGDAFIGALAAFLASGRNLDDAVARACRVAALSTTALGAQAAYPDPAALAAFEEKHDIEAY